MTPSDEVTRLILSPTYRRARWCMITLRKLCRCRLADHKLARSKLARDDEYHEAAIKYGLLSDALLVVYIFSFLHCSFCLYHQYKLDWNTVHLDYLKFRRDIGLSLHQVVVPGEELLQHLNETIKQENEWLDFLGQPLQQITFYAAAFYLGHLVWSLIAYAHTQINFNLIVPFDQYILRILVDYRRELELSEAMVEEQVNEFLVSQRNAMKTITLSQVICQDKNGYRAALDEAFEALKQDELIERELLDLKRRKELMPINRQVVWIGRWLKFHLILTSLGTVSAFNTSIVLLSILFLCLPALLFPDEPPPWLRYDFADWLNVFSIGVLLLVNCVSVLMYGATLTFGAIDQFYYARHLCALYDKFTEKSERELLRDLRWIAVGGDTSDSLRQELNCALLALVMKFRVFAKQLASERKLIGSNALSLVVLFSLLPIVNRLHSPYFNDGLLMMFTGLMSLLTLTSVSVSLLAPCEMYGQCVCLHKSRLRLLAHLIQVQLLKPNFYNAHLILLLRREAGACERPAERFAITCAGFNFTHSSVTRLHFWFGALILSSMLKPPSYRVGQTNLAGDKLTQYPLVVDNILDDPFRVLKW